MEVLSLRERLPSCESREEEWIEMGLPSAVMEKRLWEGLVLWSSASKASEMLLPSTEVERRAADCGVLEVSAILIVFCSSRLWCLESEKSWSFSCSFPSVLRSSAMA